MFRALVFLVKLPFLLVIAVVLAIWQTFILPLMVAKEENEMKAAISKAPGFFRSLRDPLGNMAIQNIENISDQTIASVYKHVSSQLRMLALRRSEKIKDSLITAVVRDCLVIHAANGAERGFDYERRMLDAYTLHGEEAIKIKGQHYG